MSNNKGVERIISDLQEGAGQLGPLEQPYDIKDRNPPRPHTDYNEADPWKYPIDLESGLRLVEWVDGDKHNPKTSPKLKMVIHLGLGCSLFCCGLGVSYRYWGYGTSSRVLWCIGRSDNLGFSNSICHWFWCWAVGVCPMSEEVGRKPIYVVTLFIAVVFIVPCGAAKTSPH